MIQKSNPMWRTGENTRETTTNNTVVGHEHYISIKGIRYISVTDNQKHTYLIYFSWIPWKMLEMAVDVVYCSNNNNNDYDDTTLNNIEKGLENSTDI